ncbi:MAG: ATP-binding protein [Chloroflexota bacterium]
MANVVTEVVSSDNNALSSWLQFLIRPAVGLNQEEYERASALAALSIVFIILAVVSVLVGPVLNLLEGEGFSLPGWRSVAAIPIVAVGYALSRTRHFMIGAYIVSLASIVAILIIILTSSNPVPPETLFFLALSIIISSLLLDTRGTFIVSGVAVTTLLFSYFYTRELATSFPVTPAIFISVTGILIIFVSRLREQNLERLHRTQQELQQSRDELAAVNASLEVRVAERTVELREARDEALAAQRIAQENSRLKSEFLSMMSHELRTPMNAIEGFTSIMLKRMAGVEYNDKAERYLTKVQSNSKRLLALINDFLDLSRIESGRLELAHSPMSPDEMGQTWHDNLSSLADNKGLELSVEVDPDLPGTVYGDEESVTKIAINLIGNAIKFTESGTVSASLQQHGDHMALIVQDTGVGIPPHARDFIFEEFRQVDQSSKRVHGGTGLGLAIVQKLTREMGGTVTLQSEVGVGSTFTVLLPIHTHPEK